MIKKSPSAARMRSTDKTIIPMDIYEEVLKDTRNSFEKNNMYRYKPSFFISGIRLYIQAAIVK